MNITARQHNIVFSTVLHVSAKNYYTSWYLSNTLCPTNAHEL